jgi:hypothetical protein
MTTEDRLRDLMCDPRWSLPAWPDAHARVRRAARRQRLTIIGVGAAVTAVITTAAMLPVLLPGRGGLGTALNPAVSAGPFATPPVGAAGFTAQIYPAAVRAWPTTGGWLRFCPSANGLQIPDQTVTFASLTVLRQAGRPADNVSVIQRADAAVSLAVQSPRQQLFTNDLRLSDRAFWPQLASGSGIAVELAYAAQAPVLYSGPLHSYHPATGPPSLAAVVSAGCGDGLVRDTWVIVSGHAARPTWAETFFLKRRGHVLIYNAT